MICVYDIETYAEAFIVCFLDIANKRTYSFEISKRKDETPELILFLQKCKGLIGFNNLDFDYPVIHWFIQNHKNYNQYSLPQVICAYAQETIGKEFSSIKQDEILIPQLDLFRIWHYGNKARITSLKYLEFNMRMENIQDLPYDINEPLDSNKIDNIIKYCNHDVYATYLFYLKSIPKIELRKKLQLKYKLPLLNRPDVGIAEDLVLDSYCKLTKKNKFDVKKTNTKHDIIVAKDVILPEIQFQTKDLQIWLEQLKKTNLKYKNQIWKGCTIKLFNEEYQIGLGGIHINQKTGKFIPEEDEFLIEFDCAGMYPTFIALHGLYPEHLGVEFLELYRDIRNQRMIAKKTGDKIMDAAGKLMGNSTFGKFGSDLSYLFDLKMLYTVTLNNQLFLLMLIEACGLNDLKVISANTDSITILDKKDKLPIFEEIKQSWEKVSLHTLEETSYKFLIFRDVNNYFGKTTNNKNKFKGAFDTFEDRNSEKFDGWHKNQSMLIVPIALEKYYSENIPVEETIKNHTDIFDFCKVVKTNRDGKFVKREQNGLEKVDYNLQKINRYIITNSGNKLIKLLKPLKDSDGNIKNDKLAIYRKENPLQLDLFHFVDDVIVEKNRETEIESGWKITILNEITEFDISKYDINYDYYIKECNKIIKQI